MRLPSQPTLPVKFQGLYKYVALPESRQPYLKELIQQDAVRNCLYSEMVDREGVQDANQNPEPHQNQTHVLIFMGLDLYGIAGDTLKMLEKTLPDLFENMGVDSGPYITKFIQSWLDAGKPCEEIGVEIGFSQSAANNLN
jgi:hypothetical protein